MADSRAGHTIHECGQSSDMQYVVKGLSSESEDPGSNPETIEFLTNSSGQATTYNATVSLFTQQCKLVPAS